MKKIRVLIVDDSSVFRTLLTKILSQDPEIEVIGSAPDVTIAEKKISSLKPDVITLDINMPHLSGIDFLEKIMSVQPIPTLIISDYISSKDNAIKALHLGAIEIIEKPSVSDATHGKNGTHICQLVKAAAKAKIKRTKAKPNKIKVKQSKTKPILNPPVTTSASINPRPLSEQKQLIGIASSTGGTEALKVMLEQLPEQIPPILIVQHMPPVFTTSFAKSLNEICAFEVKEAQNGEQIKLNCAYIAPGGFHMEVEKKGTLFFIKLHSKDPLHGVRPAADYLMRSIAFAAGSRSIGVVLTGMGKDGAQGLLSMKQAGSFNIAQDEATSLVFGMPKEAIECGAIDKILPLEKIAHQIMLSYGYFKETKQTG